jgi:predicted peroxiredoxin
MNLAVFVTFGKENIDKATISLTLANAAVDQGDKVTVIFMAEGVRLANKSYSDVLANGEPFKPIGELISALQTKGAQLNVCKPCMVNRKMGDDQVMNGIQLIVGTDVLRILKESDKSIQL